MTGLHRRAAWTALSLLGGAAGGLAACGGDEPPAKAPDAVPQESSGPRRPALRTTSELGDVDPADVKDAFGVLNDRFIGCQKRGLERVEVIAGAVKFFLRIGADGRAKWTYFEESDVGDRETEKCLLEVVEDARWPKPSGGDAEARYSMELPLQATRPPNEWSSDRVAAALGKYGEAIDRCKAGASAAFHATMYVGPGGKVLAAGVVTPSRDGAQGADCLVKVLEKMHDLPSPGSWPAKVGFDL